jgi:predicted ABC-type ATPase
MLTELERHFSQRQSFAFETTLSGRAYANAIRRWQAAGYKVELIFLKLHDAEEAIARVTQRVLQGGHHIPDEVIRRRFEQGLKNLAQIYQPLVNVWAVYDNSGEVPKLIEWSEE